MPTYEYKCLSCGHKFEVFQKMNDEPIKVCPECGGKVKKLIGAGAGLIFKGSGFYLTDYKNSSTKSDSKRVKKTNTPTTNNKTNETTSKSDTNKSTKKEK